MQSITEKVITPLLKPDKESLSSLPDFLFEHQKNAIIKMKELESLDNGKYIGVYCDPAGVGKTLVLLNVVNNIPKERNNNTKQINEYYFIQNQSQNSLNTTLIVVPNFIIKDWEYQINKFTNLTYTIQTKAKSIQIDSLPQIILIPVGIFNEFIQLNQYKYKRIIFDDCDKLPKVSHPNADFIWFVTNSPLNLIFPNKYYLDETGWIRKIDGIPNSGFIRDIFNSLTEQPLDIYIQNGEVKELISYQIQKHCCETPFEISALLDIVSKDVIKMLNANDYSSAMTYMGYKIESQEKLLATLIESFDNEIKSIELTTQNSKGDLSELEKLIMDIKNKRNSLISRILEASKCPICLESFTMSKTITKCCNNCFHLNCIQSVDKCPLCREEINKNTLMLIDPQNSPELNITIPRIKTKEKLIQDIILSKPGEKFVVYSEYDITLDYLKELIPTAVKLSRTSDHNKLLSEQRELYLINAKFYNYGHNINFIENLIFYHRMSMEMEKNVISRHLRIDRIKPLTVHYLCHNNELEAN
jgi:hypothetical protein